MHDFWCTQKQVLCAFREDFVFSFSHQILRPHTSLCKRQKLCGSHIEVISPRSDEDDAHIWLRAILIHFRSSVFCLGMYGWAIFFTEIVNMLFLLLYSWDWQSKDTWNWFSFSSVYPLMSLCSRIYRFMKESWDSPKELIVFRVTYILCLSYHGNK